MFTREKYIADIIQRLSWVTATIEQQNSLNLYSINIHAETFFCGFLNVIFGYQLNNLNFSQKNTASIDLGDKMHRVAVQVTTEKTAKKIRETLDGFVAGGYNRDYDRLVILIIGKKPKFTTTFDSGNAFSFSKENDIWGIEHLTQEIGKQDLNRLTEIHDYLEEQLSVANGYQGTDSSRVVKEMQGRAYRLCMAKLMAAGLNKATAEKIIISDIESAKYQYILDGVHANRCYLVGDFGAGKSHALLILIQRLAIKYLDTHKGSLPLFAQAREITQSGSIQQWIEHQGINNEDYFLFIDGLDEIDSTMAKQLKEEVDSLMVGDTTNHILVNSRTLLILQDSDKKIDIHPLTIEEQQTLYTIITKDDSSGVFSHLDESMQKMLVKPFFCIIFSLFQASPKSWAKTDMDLVAAFVNKTMQGCGDSLEKINLDLNRIAVKTVDMNLTDIHVSNVSLTNSLPSILKTGLVTVTGDYIGFPLPIIAQWMAADAIRHKIVSLEDIVSDKKRTERWTYSLAILFSQITYEESKEYFAKIVRTMPGIASRIIRDGLRFGHLTDLPTAYECGKMLQECMQIWIEALGPLSAYIAPTIDDKLLPLGIYTENGHIEYAWVKDFQGKSVLPMSFQQLSQKGYDTIWGCPVPSQATWPWIITFNVLSDNLEKAIKNRSISGGRQLKDEFLWDTAIRLSGKGDLYEGELDLSCFDPYKGSHGTLVLSEREISLDSLLEIVDEYIANGNTKLSPPYPTSDKPHHSGGWIWSNYSADRYLEKVRFVYGAALKEYMDLAQNVFSALKEDLRIAQLYPCELVGGLQFSTNATSFTGAPSLTHYWIAVPFGKDSNIDIQIREIPFYDSSLFNQVLQTNSTLRPEFRSQTLASISSGYVDVINTTPVTNMVFDWLKKELTAIGWIK